MNLSLMVLSSEYASLRLICRQIDFSFLNAHSQLWLCCVLLLKQHDEYEARQQAG